MNTLYAFLAIGIMVLIYFIITSKTKKREGLVGIFQSVIFQLSRSIQVFLQKSVNENKDETWRPSVVAFSNQSFNQNSSFKLLTWISRKHGFGSYIHWLKEKFSVQSASNSKETLNRLIRLSNVSHSNFYLDTLVGPSYTASLVQTLQLPGVSGKKNNMILLDFERNHLHQLDQILENLSLINASEYDLCLLGTSKKDYGVFNDIHIWIEIDQLHNAPMMIVLSYIILGNPKWKRGNTKVFIALNEKESEDTIDKIEELIFSGRIPISKSNVEFIFHEDKTMNNLMLEHSKDADLIMKGLNPSTIKEELTDKDSTENLCNILYLNSISEKKFGVDK